MLRNRWKWVWEFLWVNAGVAVVAVGLNMFLAPNKIAAGGVSGAAIIFYHLFNLPVGLLMLAMNIPIFLAGIYRLGLTFGFRSLYGTISLSAIIDLTSRYLPALTQDRLLAALFGGVVTGVGLGLVFRFRGTTGGTALAAAILRSYTGVNIGQLLFMVDAVVVVGAGLAFASWELSMYAMLSIFVTAWVIDLVQEGVSYTKAFFIISRRPGEVNSAILTQLDRGVTVLLGRGGYTGAEQEVLFTVVNRSEAGRLKEVVYEIDPQAFLVLADVREALGEGFKEYTK